MIAVVSVLQQSMLNVMLRRPGYSPCPQPHPEISIAAGRAAAESGVGVKFIQPRVQVHHQYTLATKPPPSSTVIKIILVSMYEYNICEVRV